MNLNRILRIGSPIRDSNSNPLFHDKGISSGALFKKPKLALAGHPNHSIPRQHKFQIAENSPKAERERKKENREKKFLPNPISNLKTSPSIRAPTRSPSGEKGPEGSWLRVLEVSDPNASPTFDLIDSVVSISERLELFV